MKGIVLSVSNEKESKHGGKFVRAVFKDISAPSGGKTYMFYCYFEHTKSMRFYPYLKEQAIFDNLSLCKKDGKEFIDGNSNFTYVGIRHE